MEILTELVQGIHNLDPPGQFLRECSNTNGSIGWEIATNKVTREYTITVLKHTKSNAMLIK